MLKTKKHENKDQKVILSPTYLNDSSLALNFQDLTGALGAIGQGQLNDL
jgi:hypothetical protein